MSRIAAGENGSVDLDKVNTRRSDNSKFSNTCERPCGPELPGDLAPISQVPATDTPGTKTFVDVNISKPRMKPPDLNAYELAPRLSARPVQEMQ